MAINNKFVSVVDILGEIENNIFAVIIRNSEFPDQMIYSYDEEKDDNKINEDFFKGLCKYIGGNGKYKIKINDDWNTMETIINLEEDDA